MMTIRVEIDASAGEEYEIRIGSGLLAGLGAAVREISPAPSCCIVTDSSVGPIYLEPAKAALAAAGFRVIAHTIPAGEEHKNLRTFSGAVDAFLNGGVERATPLIALGGGVVGDLAGFVAASLLRGVPFVQAPTTLLSAVDASVGGKVGIDHAAGKNLIGAFHQPRAVITDIATFQTLPLREIRCGLAECIKHGVIRDAGLFGWIEKNMMRILACEMAAMEELVSRNVVIKAKIVREDPFEHGVRALLNLGHTFGHAIENVCGYAGIQHGEAVALGMIAAGRLAVSLGKFSRDELGRLIAVIQAAGLPVNWPGLDADKTFAAMHTDKKMRGGKLRLVLPVRIGSAEIVTDVPAEPIRAAISTLAR